MGSNTEHLRNLGKSSDHCYHTQKSPGSPMPECSSAKDVPHMKGHAREMGNRAEGPRANISPSTESSEGTPLSDGTSSKGPQRAKGS